jgi:hypothetical protein
MTTSRAHGRGRASRLPGRLASTLVLADDQGLMSADCSHRLSTWDRARARCRAFALDERLAAGSSPDGDALVAARARLLVSLARRRQLARDWGHVVRVARERSYGSMVCRDRVVAAEPDIRELQRSLRAALPVPARGVAMASWLLTDATGPLYNRRTSADLGASVREVIRQLDPRTALMPGQAC